MWVTTCWLVRQLCSKGDCFSNFLHHHNSFPPCLSSNLPAYLGSALVKSMPITDCCDFKFFVRLTPLNANLKHSPPRPSCILRKSLQNLLTIPHLTHCLHHARRVGAENQKALIIFCAKTSAESSQLASAGDFWLGHVPLSIFHVLPLLWHSCHYSPCPSNLGTRTHHWWLAFWDVCHLSSDLLSLRFRSLSITSKIFFLPWSPCYTRLVNSTPSMLHHVIELRTTSSKVCIPSGVSANIEMLSMKPMYIKLIAVVGIFTVVFLVLANLQTMIDPLILPSCCEHPQQSVDKDVEQLRGRDASLPYTCIKHDCCTFCVVWSQTVWDCWAVVNLCSKSTSSIWNMFITCQWAVCDIALKEFLKSMSTW